MHVYLLLHVYLHFVRHVRKRNSFFSEFLVTSPYPLPGFIATFFGSLSAQCSKSHVKSTICNVKSCQNAPDRNLYKGARMQSIAFAAGFFIGLVVSNVYRKKIGKMDNETAEKTTLTCLLYFLMAVSASRAF